MSFKLRSDTNSALENGSATGNVLLNDSSATQVTKIRYASGSYVTVPVGGTTLQGTYGFLTINNDGSYSYTASTSAADSLKAGATASDTFTYYAIGGTHSGSTTLKFTVTGVNDAPVLTATTATLTTITEDQTTNGGQTVASFLQASDVDSGALRGVAVTGLTSGNGHWEYSINAGVSWSAVGTVADGAALLLRSTDYIRFVPNGDDGTAADFSYRAWDQSSGTAGAKVDSATNGGTTAFSTATATASIVVSAVNDAPVGNASSASGTEDGPPITGTVTASDVDSSTLTYALVANSAVGGSATINATTGAYSFTPDANFSGTASFNFTANDGSLTSAATAVTITVAGVNDAPVLTATSATLAPLSDGQTNNGGQTVASFLQSTDADANALSGVAITGLTSGNGEWQYSTDGGSNWSAVGTVADGTALLLRSTDYIRFVPDGAHGTNADFTYRAWDQSDSGAAGSKVDATTNGGATAFSTDSGTASIVVNAVNDPPVGIPSSASGTEDGPPITGTVQATDSDSPTLTYALVANSAVGGTATINSTTGAYSFALAPDFSGTASFRFTANDGSLTSAATAVTITVAAVNDAPVLTATTATLTTITEDQLTNGGQTVASFLQASDVDANALRGVAVTGLTSGNGHWEYSTNAGGLWSAVGAVTNTSALLLKSTDYIRFVPNGIDGTTANFTYRAWDQSDGGAAGTKVATATNGGETAFSTATATASIVVSAVNDAPVGNPSSASGTEDGPPITGTVTASDVDSSTLTYALVANSAVGGSVTINATTGAYSFTPAANFNGAASFNFTANDGSLTSAATAVTIAIAAVNDNPVAVADTATTTQDTPVLINVLANDTDVDGDPLTITSLGSAAHGTVQILNGQVRYAPTAGYVGSDSFTYRISDGAGGTAQSSAAVTVAAANNLPAAVSVSFRQGNNGYTGAVDTMLKQNVATTSYPDSFVLRSGLESGKDEQVLLKFGGLFGTGPGQIPVGATIVSATLQLDATGDTVDGGTLNRMLVGWSGTSTYSSLGNGVQTNGVEATATGIAIGAVALGTKIIDVTDSLLAWNAAATTSAGQNAANLGWVFNPTSTDIWDFSSSDGAVKPVLTITYTQQSSVPALPTVSISAAAPAAENSGKITFNLSLSQASSQDVTVNFSTADHTALAGSDYVAAAQSLTFLAGQTTKSIDISLVNNTVGERLEDFTVQINSVTNAKIGTGVATGQIIDDDVVVPPMPTLSPSVVHSYNLYDGTKYQDGSNGQYGISDPSGLAYIPSLGRLFVADSEHDETPFFSPTNLFSLKLDGTYDTNYSLNSYTKEPTGLAYNPNNGYLYISDDDKYQVSWVSPTNPTVLLGSFDTKHLGYLDTEDLKIDPLTGHIHELDGTLKQLIELTDQGVFVNSIPLASFTADAEALAYDPLHDLYFVASGRSTTIWIIDAQGTVEGSFDLFSAYHSFKIKGLEFAPSSDPNDGNTMSLYVANYGVDQVNDGQLFEVHLGPAWLST